MNMGIISRVISASPPPTTNPTISSSSSSSSSSIQQSKTLKRRNFVAAPRTPPSLSISTRLLPPQRIGGCCRSSTGPGAPGSGDGESRSVLDAFFLGKALAEALNERIESTVGEFLSTVGRLQAEQQKQVQDFQNEVLERAMKAKEKAAREAMEAQGLVVPKSSSAINTTSSPNTTNAAAASPPTSSSSSSFSEAGTDQEDPAVK